MIKGKLLDGRPYAGKILSMLTGIVVVVAVPLHATDFVPAGHGAHTVAFYPFTGYENGTRWTVPAGTETTTYASSAYAASAPYLTNHVADADYVVTPRIKSSGYVTVTNETPGRYLFANKSANWPLVSDFMSIRAVAANSQWTAIDLDSFGKMMASTAETTGEFTLELFVKPIDGCYGTAFYFAIDGKNTTVQIPQNAINNKHIIMDYNGTKVQKVFDADVRDSKWHHIAIVYRQPDKSVNGTTSLYYDYDFIGSLEMGRDTSKNGALRLAASATWPGIFSALRVSDKALTTDEMLRVSDEINGVRDDSDTIGFYPLNDKAIGFAFNASNCDAGTETTRDTAWSGAFSSVAESTGYNCSTTDVRLVVRHAEGTSPNVAFYTTNDVPARYVFDGVGATTPLCELATSLCDLSAAKAGSPNSSDWIGLYGLPKDLYDAADGFTLEFFAKFLSVPNATIAFFDLGPSEGNRVLLQKNTDKGLKAVFSYKADSGSTATTTASGMTYPDIDTLVDGKWHHVAIVFDGSKLRLFCDYTLAGDAIDFSKGAAINNRYEFRFGNSAQWAHFSCLRATAKPLDPSDFLYASDNVGGSLSNADWSGRLDGTVGGTLMAAEAVAAALDETQYLFKDSHGFCGVPEGDGSLSYVSPFFPGDRILIGENKTRNRAAASIVNAYLSTSPSGPLCAPGLSFTVEALVDATAPASAGATVFGAETAAGAPAWSLLVDSAGALKLAYAMQNGTAATNVVMAGFAGTAHHVALVADIPGRSLAVYVDYAKKLSLTAADIPQPLVTNGVRFMAAGGCGGSILSGMIDEVRLTHGILAQENLLHVMLKGFVIDFR